MMNRTVAVGTLFVIAFVIMFSVVFKGMFIWMLNNPEKILVGVLRGIGSGRVRAPTTTGDCRNQSRRWIW